MVSSLAESIKQKWSDQVLEVTEHQGQAAVHVRRDRILDILRWLRDEQTFVYLTDLCGLDFMNWGLAERFAICYNLYSFEKNERIRIKAFIPETDPSIDSATALWPAANWAEREAFDMYGVQFKGHPDLRRILLPENYGSFPLRKEYPVTGKGERDNFPKYYE